MYKMMAAVRMNNNDWCVERKK